MTEQIFFQTLTNAVILSLIYVLIAVGLSLILSIMRMLNLAHGEFYMLGAFSVYVIYERLGSNYWVAVMCGVAFVAFLGVLLEKAIFRRLRKDFVQGCLASLGVAYILSTSVQLIFGERGEDVATVFKGVFEVSGIFISVEKLAIVLLSGAVTGGLIIFVSSTRTGQALNAVAQDAEAAALQGVNVNRINTIGFAIGSGLAGAAGGIISPLFYVNPYMGFTPLLKCLIVITVGGLGSIPGAILASFVLGFLEQFSLTLIGYVGNILGFIIVMILLLFRPQGFFGREFKI